MKMLVIDDLWYHPTFAGRTRDDLGCRTSTQSPPRADFSTQQPNLEWKGKGRAKRPGQAGHRRPREHRELLRPQLPSPSKIALHFRVADHSVFHLVLHVTNAAGAAG
jgi:hypothetical protein